MGSFPPQGTAVHALEYQTQTGAWADPTGAVFNGRTVHLYNSTQAGYRLCAYMNGAWRNVDLLG